MLLFLRAKLNYVAVRRAQGIAPDVIQRLEQDLADSVQQKLGVYQLQLPEASEMISMLAEADGISEGLRERISNLATQHSTPSAPVLGARQEFKSQMHGHGEFDLTQSDWDTLRDPRLPVMTKVRRYTCRSGVFPLFLRKYYNGFSNMLALPT